MRLFHVSEEANIDVFWPRPLSQPMADAPDFVVWAIDEDHLPNYLLPRDCRRVTFRATTTTSAEDVRVFFDNTKARRMIVVEQAWLNRILSALLYVYEMPSASFRLLNTSAGYYLAQEPVVPLCRREVTSPLEEITSHGCELRLVPDLWPIRDGVINSTLDYSIIRMRNAQPRI